MRRHYGAGPGQLVALLLSFVLAGYAVSRLLDDLPVLLRIGVWFVGAALVWDLLLGPALAAVDRALRPLSRLGPVPVLNYVRVPLLVSGLLLLVWAPLVLQRSAPTFMRKSGLSADPYLERWLAVSAVLILGSALAYGVAVLRARRR